MKLWLYIAGLPIIQQPMVGMVSIVHIVCILYVLY